MGEVGTRYRACLQNKESIRERFSFEPGNSGDGAEIEEPHRQRFSFESIDSELTTEDVAGAYYYGEGQASYYGADDILTDDQTTEDDENSSEERGTPRQI